MILTIGHSAIPRDQFAETLKTFRVSHIIDIRTHPTSKWHHFNQAPMADPNGWLANLGVYYRWTPELSGWRRKHTGNEAMVRHMAEKGVDLSIYDTDRFPKSELGKPSAQTPWKTRGQHDFSWYTSTREFRLAAMELLNKVESGELPRPALMCSEYVWEKCHRAQVADFLCYHGAEVVHLPGSCVHTELYSQRIQNNHHTVLLAWLNAPSMLALDES